MARGSGAGTVVGLDVQPGEAVAAVVRRDGVGLRVERAAAAPLDPGLVRDGEVSDADGLGAVLKRLFAEHRLPPRVRVGLAGQRALMRTIDLPPLEDPDDIAAAVQIQAPDHIAMPLAQAVVDHHTLGRVETADGPRTRVVVAAAPREPVQRLLDALARARLRPAGVDLSAFALVRGLHEGRGDDAPLLYVHAAGVTTLALARGLRCELTRTAPVGLELLAGRLAERNGVVLDAARERLLAYGRGTDDADALGVLDRGLEELADNVRNTIEFHARGQGGASVAEIVLSGPLATVPNFCEVLEQRVGTPVRAGAPAGDHGDVEPERTAVAAGLAVEELAA